MLLEAERYNWSRWEQPIFTDNESWGKVSATNTHVVTPAAYEPYCALDGNSDTQWETADMAEQEQFVWEFDRPLKIYRIEMVNKKSGSNMLTSTVSVYADLEREQLVLQGSFEAKAQSRCVLEPEEPFCADCLVLDMTTYNRYIGLSELRIIAEVGEEKTTLIPYLDTTEGMEVLLDAYNDDGTHTTEGLGGFYFNGIVADRLYISSNHWVGFGTNSGQLKVLNRDGCATKLYHQTGETANGMTFRKIRFEGYTVYSNCVESNRLIFELFLLGNNDMLLHVIQTPTSGNTGASDFTCNGRTTALTLHDGQGGGAPVSFYHLDDAGRTWEIRYAMYEEKGEETALFLLASGESYFTQKDKTLQRVEPDRVSAAMFLKYGFPELPDPALVATLTDPHIYRWKAGGARVPLEASIKAYPYPQTLTAIADMSHSSIVGIKLMTAEFSGNVTVSVSVDGAGSFSDPVPMMDWLNTDWAAFWESLPEPRAVHFRFTLHDNAVLSRFKITYYN